MWVINIEAFPNPQESPDDFKEFGGAIVNCWINFAIEDGAIELSKFYIKQNGWNPSAIIDENVWLDEEDCETAEQKQYFAEAAEYGATLVWHYYYLEADKADEDFEMENATTKNQKFVKTEH
jgi:hypothetical protein